MGWIDDLLGRPTRDRRIGKKEDRAYLHGRSAKVLLGDIVWDVIFICPGTKGGVTIKPLDTVEVVESIYTSHALVTTSHPLEKIARMVESAHMDSSDFCIGQLNVTKDISYVVSCLKRGEKIINLNFFKDSDEERPHCDHA